MKISNLIQSEKKIRDESEENIYEMVRDIINKVKDEIEFEKKTRQITFVIFIFIYFIKESQLRILYLIYLKIPVLN